MSLGSGTGGTGSLKGEATVSEPTRHERAVARRSAEIRATVPHAEFTTVVTMDAALAGAASAQVPTFSVVLAAVAAALAATPRLNGSYRDGRMERYARVNIGVTIAAEGLYVLPTIFDSDAKSVTELASELTDYRERALADRLESAELTGATFSVSDLSENGIVAGPPLVVGGHAGALSVGAVRAVPVVSDGAVIPGHELILTLAVDHRIVQAPDAGAFLTEVRTRLEAA